MAGHAVLTVGEWSARFDSSGLLERLDRGAEQFVTEASPRPPIVEVGGEQFRLGEPASLRCDGAVVRVEYALPAHTALSVSLEYRLVSLLGNGVALETVVTLTPAAPIQRDVCVRLPATVAVGQDTELFGPRKNGVGYIGRGGPPAGHFVWELAGRGRQFLGGYVEPLGLPLVSERGDGPWRLTWCTDPYFTTSFELAPRSLSDAPDRELNWTYLGAVRWSEPEQRRVYACLHEGDEERALQAFYDTALADVPAGPAWLHDIALTHYDYFAKAGQGWFEDIDTLSAKIAPEDRHRVCLCLHGWYDRLGGYSTNAATREIEARWTLVRSHDLSGQSGLEVTREEITRRLRYARERGFRTTLYFGDGLIAGFDWADEVLPKEAVLRCAGWDEGAAQSVLLNPLHPDVRRWFLDYARALTAAFGDDVDGFVWDETYFIAAGELGPVECPGYLDRAFMTLTRELTEAIHEHRDDLAFLGSDNVGIAPYCDGSGHAAVGYSLVADGCWQDSACNPEAWPFGVFPNYRNVHWSCNWWPVGNFPATEYGARNFGTPAVTTNGFGENRSLAEFPDGALDRILNLFHDLTKGSRRKGWLVDGDPRTPGRLGTHPLEVNLPASATPTGG